jgi:hypothetical protein
MVPQCGNDTIAKADAVADDIEEYWLPFKLFDLMERV